MYSTRLPTLPRNFGLKFFFIKMLKYIYIFKLFFTYKFKIAKSGQKWAKIRGNVRDKSSYSLLFII